jgi:hypothetical protein
MEHWASVEEIWEPLERDRRRQGRAGLPMSGAAANSKLPLIFPLLYSWLVAMNLMVI